MPLVNCGRCGRPLPPGQSGICDGCRKALQRKVRRERERNVREWANHYMQQENLNKEEDIAAVWVDIKKERKHRVRRKRY